MKVHNSKLVLLIICDSACLCTISCCAGHDGTDASGPFLIDEIMSLKGLDLVVEQTGSVQPAEAMRESAAENPSAAVQDQKPTEKKAVKPKWLKM